MNLKGFPVILFFNKGELGKVEDGVKKEHRVLTSIRVAIAFLIGLALSLTDCLCAYESIYLEAVLAAIGIVIFPYLTYLRKSFHWLFLVYGTVILLALNYIYIQAKHGPIIPEFLMTSSVHKPTEYEVVDIRKNYLKPDILDEEYLVGHRYGWDVTHWRFVIIDGGRIEYVPEESIPAVLEGYQTVEELAKRSLPYQQGVKDGSRAAAQDIKNYSRNLLKKVGP